MTPPKVDALARVNVACRCRGDGACEMGTTSRLRGRDAYQSLPETLRLWGGLQD